MTGCNGGSGGGGGSAVSFDVLEATHGFGQLLPHRVQKADAAGNPTSTTIQIREDKDLFDNVTPTNPILANVQFEEGKVLPGGNPGNHFFAVQFTKPVDPLSVFSLASSTGVIDNLTGAITISSVDPLTGAVTGIRGQGFINGYTVDGVDPNPPPGAANGQLRLVRWVERDSSGKPVAIQDVKGIIGNQPGLGFPGTEDDGFNGASDLVRDDVFVFVPDIDGDLQTHETFPSGEQVRMRIDTGVRSVGGLTLRRPAVASATVGVDDIQPEVRLSVGSNNPVVSPPSGQPDVDPRTNIALDFTEPVQPFSVGPQPTGAAPTLSGAVQIQFGPTASSVSVPFTARPFSVYDLTRYEIDPAFDFPGQGPTEAVCGIFNRITVSVSTQQVQDLSAMLNTKGASSFFLTGEGPGLVNAPVTPDAVYIGLGGSQPGVSVIDLNGFGGGTGNPTFDPLEPIKRGNSNYPNNPNVRFQASALTPPLSPVGSCTFDGGSEGSFTLTKDSSLQTRLLRPPLISSVDDMMLGHALDTSFNNAPPPFGCQSGGGSLCASGNLKLVSPITTSPNTLGPTLPNQFANIFPGQENLASWAPHPNPPPLVFPPLCLSPLIGAQEPTSVETTAANLLGPNPNFQGFAAGGVPPGGLASREQNSFFLGPSAPKMQITSCLPYQIRQQVGYFMYVCDRIRGEVVVINSNRFTVIERIPLPDPTSLAMSPNLDFLGVTNQASGSVSFIDINPSSANFHKVIKTTKVGKGPRGIAWNPGNEDIFVCNETGNTVSVISAFSLNLRKTLANQLNRPFDVVITQRQNGFGFGRNVYFAFILNRDGTVALFESGPNGLNGWGFDEIIGVATFEFQNPKAIVLDPINLQGGCWIVHENELDPFTGQPIGNLGQPAVSNLFLESAATGQQALNNSSALAPFLRDIEFAVQTSIGPEQITGIAVDIAFDNLMNFSGLPNTNSVFSAGTPVQANGKSQVRGGNNVNEASYMFLAVPNSNQGGGVVDVIRMDTGFLRLDTDPFESGTQSIPVPGVSILMDYFRQ